MKQNKKITLATIKKFIRDNKENLYACCEASFDGMVDCVVNEKGGFTKVAADQINMSEEHNLGINALWFVRDSRDYFEPYNKNGFLGYRIFNSCGSSVISIKSAS